MSAAPSARVIRGACVSFFLFFFNDTATTEIYTLSLHDALPISRAVVASGLAPRGMESAEKVMVAVQTGMEAGLTPMRALSSVVVIGGVPTWKGDAARALVEASGELKQGTHVQTGTRAEGDQLTGWCRTWARDATEPEETTFATADAKRAGLWGKQGPWTQYPQRMLQYRALGFHLRDHFGAVLMGLRTAEEQQDMVELHQVTSMPAAGPAQVPAWAMHATEVAQPAPLDAVGADGSAPHPIIWASTGAELEGAPDPDLGTSLAEEDAGGDLPPPSVDPDPEPVPPAPAADHGGGVGGRYAPSPAPVEPPRRPRAMAKVQFAAPEPAVPDPARSIGPEEQAAIWAVVRARYQVKSEATAVLARVLGKHGCRRTAEVTHRQLDAVLKTARTI